MALATVTVVNNQVVVRPFGADLLAPLIASATAQVALAEAWADAAEGFKDEAETALAGAVAAKEAIPEIVVEDGALFYVDADGFKRALALELPPTDVFVSVGQSNAEGRGTVGDASPTTKQYYISGSTITYPLADPVGGALNASMWPSFANEWLVQTGRRAAVVDAAKGSTALLAAAATGQGDWSPTGVLRSGAVTSINTAIDAINDSPDHTLGNVRLVWCQGENEAAAINGTTVTGALYKQALKDLADYFDANVTGGIAEMLVVRTGARNGRENGAAWAEIRAAQDEACAEHSLLRMAYRGTSSFPLDAQAIMEDSVHYNRTGLNLAGNCAARQAASTGDAAVPAAPVILASQMFDDTDPAAANSRTVSHTVAADTEALLVVVSATRLAASNALTVAANFGGVAMTKLSLPFTGSAGANGTVPRAWAEVDLFVLTPADYGGPLAGATANIVVTTANNAQRIVIGAFNLDAPFKAEVSGNSLLNNGATGTTLTTTLYPGAPCLLIGAASSSQTGGTVLTHTTTGLTEDIDSGLALGDASQTGQGIIGHGTAEANEPTEITVLASGTMSAGALVVWALRGLVEGE